MNPWLREHGRLPRDPVARLVCVPHAGGASSYFRTWRAELPASVQLLGVQFPGRQDRMAEPCEATVAALASGVAGAVAGLPAFRSLPVTLFGHSLGAAVAYEAARLLEHRYGVGLTHLIVSGRPPPHRDRGGDVHLRSDDDLWREVAELGGTDLAALASPEMRALVLPVLRADYRASETYRSAPGRLLTCPVSAFVGAADPEVTAEEAAEWATVTSGPFATRTFPGGHFAPSTDRTAVVAAVAAVCTMRAVWPSTP